MTNSNKDKLVLVTGGTGFVGSHCVLQLLNRGYNVRTTLRSLDRQNELVEALRNGGASGLEKLSFVEADLSKDTNWDEAVKNCDYVLHVASPITLERPKDENELIGPAVEGTLRVLRASRDAGVKRVVLTSSFGAIGYGHKPTEVPFTEETWTNTNYEGISAYVKRIVGLFNSTARTIVPQLGQFKNASSEKARTILGWKPRTNEEAIVASAESVLRLGLRQKLLETLSSELVF